MFSKLHEYRRVAVLLHDIIHERIDMRYCRIKPFAVSRRSIVPAVQPCADLIEDKRIALCAPRNHQRGASGLEHLLCGIRGEDIAVADHGNMNA